MSDSPPEVLGRCPPQHNHAPEAFCTLTLCPFPAPRRDEHRRRVPGAEFADGRLAWCTAPRLLAAQLELPTVNPCSHSEGLRPRGRLGTHAWTALGPLRAAAARSQACLVPDGFKVLPVAYLLLPNTNEQGGHKQVLGGRYSSSWAVWSPS